MRDRPQLDACQNKAGGGAWGFHSQESTLSLCVKNLNPCGVPLTTSCCAVPPSEHLLLLWLLLFVGYCCFCSDIPSNEFILGLLLCTQVMCVLRRRERWLVCAGIRFFRTMLSIKVGTPWNLRLLRWHSGLVGPVTVSGGAFLSVQIIDDLGSYRHIHC